jgi:hypothetical protein
MPVIVYISKQGCGACDQFDRLVWNQVVNDRSLSKFSFQKVPSAAENPQVDPAWDHLVQGFPTVLAINNNIWNQWFGRTRRRDPIPAQKYPGSRTQNEFRAWLSSVQNL